MLGLGEAGSAIGSGLGQRGLEIRGFDPDASRRPRHVSICSTPGEALEGADLILAVTKAVDSRDALESVLGLAAGPYVDLSTSSLAQVRDRERLAVAAGLHYLDGAIMAPVPGRGADVPVLVAGREGQGVVLSACDVGLNWTFAGHSIVDAVTRKLLRSVVVKGLAASIIESLAAAHAAGIEEEMMNHIVETLAAVDAEFVGRLLRGTAVHHRRREEEMRAAVALVQGLGIEPLMSDATARSLREWSEEPMLPVRSEHLPSS